MNEVVLYWFVVAQLDENRGLAQPCGWLHARLIGRFGLGGFLRAMEVFALEADGH
jgi:hypothetical protein